MRWVYYFLLSLPVAVLGLIGGGFIGNACVRWYRISNFEGGAGYAMIAIALLGGLVGLVTALCTTGFLGPQGGAGYVKAVGASVGVLMILALLTTSLCWYFADIPPEIDGRPLVLEIELKLPTGMERPPVDGTGETSLALYSVVNHVGRAHEDGAFHLDQARQENERWIVPGEVSVFTMRGRRSLSFMLNGKTVDGFLVPLPARPGREYLEWSEWGPRPPAPLPPWPDSKPSYRFRVQKKPEPPPQPTYEEIQAQEAAEEQAKFDALSADSPLPDWFPYTFYGAREDRLAIAITKMTARPHFQAELAQLMLDADPRQAESALRLIPNLTQQPPELLASVAAAGRDLAERIRKVNATTVEQDPSFEGAADVSIRFNGWMSAVRVLREKAGGDFTPELKTILELSRILTDSYVMRADVCRVASYYMKEWAGLEPLPSDPPPR